MVLLQILDITASTKVVAAVAEDEEGGSIRRSICLSVCLSLDVINSGRLSAVLRFDVSLIKS